MKHKWIRALALQIVEMLVIGLLAALSQEWSALARGVMLWGIAPLAGLLTACRAVLRGLNNYIAWIVPVPCLFAANHLLWGFSPPIGPTLLVALTGLVGAAAGQVLLQQSHSNPKKRRS